MTADELIVKATEQYHRYCKDQGHIPTQPSSDRCEVTQRRVRLANVNGVIAEYERLPDGKLRILRK